jgi:uncharacterized coiled-coil protein SlyX
VAEGVMTKDPDDVVLVTLAEIRAILDDHSKRFERLEARMKHVEKRVECMSTTVRYAVEQVSTSRLRQAQQESRIDELYDKLEKFFANRAPV